MRELPTSVRCSEPAMKPIKKKTLARTPEARETGKPRAGTPNKKPSVVRGGAANRPRVASVKPKHLPTPSRSPTFVKRATPEREWPAFAAEILRELAAIRSAVAPKQVGSQGADAALESAVDSMRRLLSELLESDHEAILRDLAHLRLAVADPHASAQVALERIDRLMDHLGAIPFSAQKLDFVDPLIHEVKAERRISTLPEGVIAEGLRPGFRTARGVVVAKAWVAVNRRPADEPSRH